VRTRSRSLVKLGVFFLMVGTGVTAGFVSASESELSPSPSWSAFPHKSEPNQSPHAKPRVTIVLRDDSGQTRVDP
jgi:hypothetical protein